MPCHQHGQVQIRVAHVGCRTEKAKGQSQPGGRTSTKSSVEALKGIGPEDFHPRVGMSKVQKLGLDVAVSLPSASGSRQVSANYVQPSWTARGDVHRSWTTPAVFKCNNNRLRTTILCARSHGGRRTKVCSRCGVEKCAAVPSPGR
jgi:hypothetical protein